jgi:hypothetical protein
MPKTDIDYSNTIFYKIHCKNPDIKDVYIGHTTNFVQRKHAHKRSCTHETSANYNCKVYNVIRQYGGWDNWNMEIIAFRECADHYSARKIEQQYFEEYNATLNSIEPLPKPKVTEPKPVRVKVEKKLLYTKNADTSVQQNSKIFTCEHCNYSTCRDSQYKRHLSTPKHKETYEVLTNASANISSHIEYTCDCGKSYNHRQSLHKHKPKCKKTIERTEPLQPAADNATELAIDKLFVLVKELMLQLAVKDKQHQELIQENKEFQNTMNEMISHLGNKKIYKKVLPEIKLDKSVI